MRPTFTSVSSWIAWNSPDRQLLFAPLSLPPSAKRGMSQKKITPHFPPIPPGNLGGRTECCKKANLLRGKGLSLLRGERTPRRERKEREREKREGERKVGTSASGPALLELRLYLSAGRRSPWAAVVGGSALAREQERERERDPYGAQRESP